MEKKILIVGDDEVCRKAIENFAKKNNIASDSAGSGSEAVEKIKAFPTYSLILIDINMPGMDGYETAKALKEAVGDSLGKMVVMSGGKFIFFLNFFLDELDEAEYTSKGFCHYIQKPVGKKSFEKLINDLQI